MSELRFSENFGVIWFLYCIVLYKSIFYLFIFRTVWPLSLLAFHASVHSVSLPNRPVTADTSLCERLLKDPKTFISADISSVKPSQDIVGDGRFGNRMTKLRSKGQKPRMETARLPKDSRQMEVGPGSAVKTLRDGHWLQLDHCYRRHVKPKKQHEIMTLAPVRVKGLCKVKKFPKKWMEPTHPAISKFFGETHN